MAGDGQARGGLQHYAPGGKGKTVLDEITERRGLNARAGELPPAPPAARE